MTELLYFFRFGEFIFGVFDEVGVGGNDIFTDGSERAPGFVVGKFLGDKCLENKLIVAAQDDFDGEMIADVMLVNSSSLTGTGFLGLASVRRRRMATIFLSGRMDWKEGS